MSRRLDPHAVPALIATAIGYVLCAFVAACGGIEQPGIECAGPSSARRCDQGGVYIVEGTDTNGTITSCTSTCVVGASCTFTTPDGFVDGVCR